MAEQQLDLLKLAAGGSAQFRARTPEVVGAMSGTRTAAAYFWSSCQTTFSLRPAPCTLSLRVPSRETQDNRSYPASTVGYPRATSTVAAVVESQLVLCTVIQTAVWFPRRLLCGVAPL